MGSACGYTAIVVVCLGIGLLCGGAGVYFGLPHVAKHVSVVTRKASCIPRSNNFPLSNQLSSPIDGIIQFTQPSNMDIKILVNITGLPQKKLGFHVHTYGVTDYDCSSAGGHFNPRENAHGGPTSKKRHVGDLGNIDGSKFPQEIVVLKDTQATLFGQDSIIGRSIVIHEDEDDLKDPTSAGGRLACCTIQKNKNELL